MKTYTATPDFYRDYICHYNHNHDPRTGQFTSSRGATVMNGQKQYSTAYSTGKYKFFSPTIARMESDIKSGKVNPSDLSRTDEIRLRDFQLSEIERKNPGFKEWYDDKDSDYADWDFKNPEKHVEEFKKVTVSQKAKDDLNRIWDYRKETYEDYKKRQMNAYDEYVKIFNKETKNAEAEMDKSLKSIMPKDGVNLRDSNLQYCTVAALLSPYYDQNNFKETVSHILFYKYDDGDQGSDNSAHAQLVSNYGYDNAKKRIEAFAKNDRNFEEAVTKQFGKETANNLINAKWEKNNEKSDYFTYRIGEGDIAETKENYEKAIKKSKLLNDAVTFENYTNTNAIAKRVANKIESARKSGLTYEEIADKYGVSTSFIGDVLREAGITK